MVKTPAITRRIYQMLFELCPAYGLPRPWAAIRADADVRACPEDPSAMLAHLASHFDAEDLISAGVAERAGMGAPNEGALVPAPPLTPGAPLIFLRYSPNQAPIEILTAAGGLSGWHLPVIASLDDHHTIAAIEMRRTIEIQTGLGAGDPFLLAACTIEDVVVLRALGLPATLAIGMDTINRNRLRQLMDRYGWRERSSCPAGFRPGAGLPGGCPEQGEAQARPEHSQKQETPGPAMSQPPAPEPATPQGPTSQAPTSEAPMSQPPKSQARAPQPSATQARAPQVSTTQEATTGPPSGSKSSQTNQTAPKNKTLHEVYLEHEAKRAREAKRPYQEEADTTLYPAILLVGWSPTRVALETPASLARIIIRLRNIEKNLKLQRLNVGIWTPPQRDVDRLRFILDFNPCLLRGDHMFIQVQEASGDAMVDSLHDQPPASNYADARNEYCSALTSSRSDPKRLQRARGTYRDRLEEELIQPLQQPTAPPAERSLRATLMDVSRLAHLYSPLLEASLSLVRSADEAAEIITRDLQPLDVLIKNALKITKELHHG
jgi:hypothetical protein